MRFLLFCFQQKTSEVRRWTILLILISKIKFRPYNFWPKQPFPKRLHFTRYTVDSFYDQEEDRVRECDVA